MPIVSTDQIGEADPNLDACHSLHIWRNSGNRSRSI